MAVEGEAITASGYIKHHLQNLTFGMHPEHGWSFAHSAADAQAMGFWAFHVDTMFWSLLLGGFIGALLAVPLTASVKVLFRRYVWGCPSESGAERSGASWIFRSQT